MTKKLAEALCNLHEEKLLDRRILRNLSVRKVFQKNLERCGLRDLRHALSPAMRSKGSFVAVGWCSEDQTRTGALEARLLLLRFDIVEGGHQYSEKIGPRQQFHCLRKARRHFWK